MRRTALAALCLLSLAGPASAATDTTSFTVTATVLASCDVSANNLAFLNYDPISPTPRDVTTTIVVICTNGTGYDVGLNIGVGAGATYAARRMTHAGQTLAYSLYSDGAHSIVWGEAIGVDAVHGTGSGANQTLTVHGRIPAGQTAPAGGPYSDTITVTVTY